MPKTFLEEMERRFFLKFNVDSLENMSHHEAFSQRQKMRTLIRRSVTEAAERMIEDVSERKGCGKDIGFELVSCGRPWLCVGCNSFNQARKDLISAAKSMGIKVKE